MAQSQPHLIPPLIDLDHVSRYNEHGRLLCSLIREHAIPERHHSLILGLFSVYSLLVSLGHFSDADISWPPHTDFRRQGWLNIGFTPEVVNILELLPYLLHDISNRGSLADIAHNAPALPYLGNAKPAYRGPLEIPNFVARTDFFITGDDSFSHFHYYYLYKSDDATMTIMTSWHDRWDSYNSLQFHPAELIMKNWVQNIYDLVFLPVHTILDALHVEEFDRRTLYRKAPFQADFLTYATQGDWPTKFPQVIDQRLNEINAFRGIQNMYRKFGWPDQFDREGFLSALDDFDKKVYDLDKRLRQSNPRAFSLVMDLIFTPEDMAIKKEKNDFLEEMAGPLAVRQL